MANTPLRIPFINLEERKEVGFVVLEGFAGFVATFFFLGKHLHGFAFFFLFDVLSSKELTVQRCFNIATFFDSGFDLIASTIDASFITFSNSITARFGTMVGGPAMTTSGKTPTVRLDRVTDAWYDGGGDRGGRRVGVGRVSRRAFGGDG